MLSNYFGAASLLKVVGRVLDPMEEKNDAFGWLDPNNLKFTVRSTYSLLMGGRKECCLAEVEENLEIKSSRKDESIHVAVST